ncbi:MAG: PilZ domain-containing protein [Desulfarculaceae bacterium]|nr:PilZ domain-containing protein [Desulfarculaceae bacterium]
MASTVIIDCLDTAEIECQECGRKKIFQLSEYPIRDGKVRVRCRCRCGHVYSVRLQKRNEERAETHLAGTYVTRGRNRSIGKMIVKKISGKGLMVKTNLGENLMPGLKMVLEFVLDDVKQSIVRKEVVVRACHGRYLSADFISEDHRDNLGPYIFFHRLYS